jgi:hypothetical protein
VSGLTYDAGVLLAADSNDRRMWVIHSRALSRSHTPTVPAGTLAQSWRGGPQPLLSRLIDGCAVEPLDDAAARLAGATAACGGTSDVVDASVVVGALRRSDAVVTSDRSDLEHLARAFGRRLDIISI